MRDYRGVVCRLLFTCFCLAWAVGIAEGTGTTREELDGDRRLNASPCGCRQAAPFEQEHNGSHMGTLDFQGNCDGFPNQVCPRK